MKKENCSQKSFRRKVHNKAQPFIVYYVLMLKFEPDQELKSIILACSEKEAKEILFKKIRRDYLACEVKKIQAFIVRKNSYKGKRLSDKEWDNLLKLAYPNTRHKLYKFNKDARSKKITSPHRDESGRFLEGNTPWNKNLKVQIVLKNKDGKFKSSRDSKGKFKKGYRPIVVGAKTAKNVSEYKV
tara:strand:- start:974 stop:1528 length:555 start_codon:yes stop_codon:yes gene_type:complete